MSYYFLAALITCGLGAFCLLLAIRYWMDSRNSAADVYFGIGSWILLCAVTPWLLLQDNGGYEAPANLYIWLFSIDGLVGIALALVNGIVAAILAAKCFGTKTTVKFHPIAKAEEHHEEEHEGEEGEEGEDDADDAHHEHHAHGKPQTVAAAVFTLIALAMFSVVIHGLYVFGNSVNRAAQQDPWVGLVAAARKYDAEIRPTFHAERSPFPSFVLPGNIIDPAELTKFKLDVEKSVSTLKLPIKVGDIVNVIVEGREPGATDMVVLYKEVDAANQTINTRAVRFRDPRDDNLLREITLAIDGHRRAKLLNPSTQHLRTLGLPSSTASPRFSQHSIVNPGP